MGFSKPEAVKLILTPQKLIRLSQTFANPRMAHVRIKPVNFVQQLAYWSRNVEM